MLFDCGKLAGNLEEFPPFMVNKIPHRFTAYNAGAFDKVVLMKELKLIVETGIKIMGDFLYKQYTFLGIGPANGVLNT